MISERFSCTCIVICFTFSSGFPVIFHLERWSIVRNKDRRKCSFTRLQMYQSRQRIGGKTEYAVEKKFERRARGRKGLSPPPSESDGDESPSNAKRAIMGQSRRAERRSLGVGWTDGCADVPPARLPAAKTKCISSSVFFLPSSLYEGQETKISLHPSRGEGERERECGDKRIW